MIDEHGVQTIPDKFDITPSAVCNWRRGIPENRRDELLNLLARRRDTGTHKPTQGVPEPTQDVTVATLPSTSQTEPM